MPQAPLMPGAVPATVATLKANGLHHCIFGNRRCTFARQVFPAVEVRRESRVVEEHPAKVGCAHPDHRCRMNGNAAARCSKGKAG